MENTGIHYLTYDPEAIWDEMIATYVEEGGDVLYGGDEKEILLRGVQAIIVQMFAGVDNALRMATLRYATGDYLKILGESRDCEYIEAAAARGTVKITFRASSTALTIPAGAAMTADGERYFALADDVYQSGYAQEVSAEIVCTEPGAIGNGLGVGTAMQFTTTYPAVTGITVTQETSGGMDAEDEEIYRERIRQSGLTSITTGPESQYEAITKAVSSEIIDASAMMLSPGVVGVYLLLKDGAASGAIIDQVRSALSAKDVRPLTDTVDVALCGTKRYTLNMGYQTGENADTQTHNAIASAVEEYTAWQNNTIGRPFNPDRLVALMYQAGCTRVVFQEGSVFDGGAVVYTEIPPDTRVTGEISLAVMT